MARLGAPDRAVGRGFEIVPAIDILGGHVVRLRQGRFARATTYGSDPTEVAHTFVDAGARLIHVVDLDGAHAGRPIQLDVVGRVARVVGGRARLQVGGGLRTVEAVAAARVAGADRVVIGTRAVLDPDFAAAVVGRAGPEAVVAALDVRRGTAVGDGWRRGAPGRTVTDALIRLADAGIDCFAVTAIERDGTLKGPDLALLRRLVALDRGGVLAAGGIASEADLAAIRGAGCDGAIVGRAIYEGHLDLARAIERLG